MILIYFIIFTFIKVSKSSVDPRIAMCIDGELDTAVLTLDGSTYIFMRAWFWKLNENLDAVIGNGSRISDHWLNLPNNIDTSFYVSGKNNRLYGKTFFVKNNIWYQFENQTFEKNDTTENWPQFPKGEVLAITEYDDPVIVFYKRLSTQKSALYFDTPYFPESKGILRENLPFDRYKTKALISYPNGKFLIFFDDERIGEHCIMSDSNSGCVVWRLNRELFECPDYTENLFDKNLFITIWYKTGLGLKQFGILVLGFLISLSLIFLFLLLILGLRVITLIKSKNQ